MPPPREWVERCRCEYETTKHFRREWAAGTPDERAGGVGQTAGGPRSLKSSVSATSVRGAAHAVIQLLASIPARIPVWLVDGDAFQESNRSRALFL